MCHEFHHMADTDVAVIVVQHLSFHHETLYVVLCNVNNCTDSFSHLVLQEFRDFPQILQQLLLPL